MADSTPTDDPVAQIAFKHLARMEEISDQAFISAKSLVTDNTHNIRKLACLRLTALEEVLKSLDTTPCPSQQEETLLEGISSPPEALV